jgi:hypothetical protein
MAPLNRGREEEEGVMFLLPLVVIVMVGYVAYRVLHRQPQPASGMVGAPSTVTAHRTAFWPTTLEGRLGVGAFAFGIVLMALVNVIQIPFGSWAVLLAALALTGVARIVRHDHSVSVLVVLIVTALATLAGLLFLGGEIFIGHD